jgi:excisionase family DNA binding protein
VAHRADNHTPIIDLTDGASRRNREPLIDIKEVAARLGVEVRHIRRLVNEQRIPFVKWGHLLRFDPTEVDAWIDEWRRQPRRPA